MKKNEFDFRPELVTDEGQNVRICFDIEAVENEMPAIGDEEPVVREVFEAYVVRVDKPITRDRIVDAIITAEYPNDKMQAVVNNYLLNQKDAEHKAEFQAMQEWRAKAKNIANEILS